MFAADEGSEREVKQPGRARTFFNMRNEVPLDGDAKLMESSVDLGNHLVESTKAAYISKLRVPMGGTPIIRAKDTKAMAVAVAGPALANGGDVQWSAASGSPNGVGVTLPSMDLHGELNREQSEPLRNAASVAVEDTKWVHLPEKDIYSVAELNGTLNTAILQGALHRARDTNRVSYYKEEHAGTVGIESFNITYADDGTTQRGPLQEPIFVPDPALVWYDLSTASASHEGSYHPNTGKFHPQADADALTITFDPPPNLVSGVTAEGQCILEDYIIQTDISGTMPYMPDASGNLRDSNNRLVYNGYVILRYKRLQAVVITKPGSGYDPNDLPSYSFSYRETNQQYGTVNQFPSRGYQFYPTQEETWSNALLPDLPANLTAGPSYQYKGFHPPQRAFVGNQTPGGDVKVEVIAKPFIELEVHAPAMHVLQQMAYEDSTKRTGGNTNMGAENMIALKVSMDPDHPHYKDKILRLLNAVDGIQVEVSEIRQYNCDWRFEGTPLEDNVHGVSNWRRIDGSPGHNPEYQMNNPYTHASGSTEPHSQNNISARNTAARHSYSAGPTKASAIHVYRPDENCRWGKHGPESTSNQVGNQGPGDYVGALGPSGNWRSIYGHDADGEQYLDLTGHISLRMGYYRPPELGFMKPPPDTWTTAAYDEFLRHPVGTNGDNAGHQPPVWQDSWENTEIGGQKYLMPVTAASVDGGNVDSDGINANNPYPKNWNIPDEMCIPGGRAEDGHTYLGHFQQLATRFTLPTNGGLDYFDKWKWVAPEFRDMRGQYWGPLEYQDKNNSQFIVVPLKCTWLEMDEVASRSYYPGVITPDMDLQNMLQDELSKWSPNFICGEWYQRVNAWRATAQQFSMKVRLTISPFVYPKLPVPQNVVRSELNDIQRYGTQPTSEGRTADDPTNVYPGFEPETLAILDSSVLHDGHYENAILAAGTGKVGGLPFAVGVYPRSKAVKVRDVSVEQLDLRTNGGGLSGERVVDKGFYTPRRGKFGEYGPFETQAFAINTQNELYTTSVAKRGVQKLRPFGVVVRSSSGFAALNTYLKVGTRVEINHVAGLRGLHPWTAQHNVVKGVFPASEVWAMGGLMKGLNGFDTSSGGSFQGALWDNITAGHLEDMAVVMFEGPLVGYPDFVQCSKSVMPPFTIKILRGSDYIPGSGEFLENSSDPLANDVTMLNVEVLPKTSEPTRWMLACRVLDKCNEWMFGNDIISDNRFRDGAQSDTGENQLQSFLFEPTGSLDENRQQKADATGGLLTGVSSYLKYFELGTTASQAAVTYSSASGNPNTIHYQNLQTDMQPLQSLRGPEGQINKCWVVGIRLGAWGNAKRQQIEPSLAGVTGNEPTGWVSPSDFLVEAILPPTGATFVYGGPGPIKQDPILTAGAPEMGGELMPPVWGGHRFGNASLPAGIPQFVERLLFPDKIDLEVGPGFTLTSSLYVNDLLAMRYGIPVDKYRVLVPGATFDTAPTIIRNEDAVANRGVLSTELGGWQNPYQSPKVTTTVSPAVRMPLPALGEMLNDIVEIQIVTLNRGVSGEISSSGAPIPVMMSLSPDHLDGLANDGVTTLTYAFNGVPSRVYAMAGMGSSELQIGINALYRDNGVQRMQIPPGGRLTVMFVAMDQFE